MNAPATNNTPKPTQPKNGKSRPASQESVAARAARMARKEVRERVAAWSTKLGIKAEDPEQFEAAIASMAKERDKGMTDSERSTARVAELEGALKKANDENARLKNALNRSEKERKREVQRRKNEQIESEILKAVDEAGFKDRQYALHLFREHVVGEGAHAADPKAFFDSLKSKDEMKPLFREEVVAAGPKPTAPAGEKPNGAAGGEPAPEQQTRANLPDQGAPPPAKPGKAGPTGEPETVDGLKAREFADRTHKKYGFRPSRPQM